MRSSLFKLYKTGLSVLTISLLASCGKNYLDIKPKGRVIVQTTAEYDLMLNASGLAVNNMNVGVPMGDEVIAVDDYFTSADIRTQRLFRWDDVIYEEGVFALEMSSFMTNMYTYNKIINEVMESDGLDATKKAILAEAKASRAFLYFNLVNMYGKPYNAATAATDPGFPIILEADVTQTQFTRASVQQVYDLMIEDLTTAIPELPVTIRARIRFGRAAAEMLLGKVYVFMGRFNDARSLLDASLTNLARTGAGTVLTNMELYDYNVTMVPNGTWKYNPTTTASTFFNGIPTQATYTENILTRSVASNPWSFTASELILSPEARHLYTSTDKRLNFFTARPYGTTGSYPVAGALRRNGPSPIQNGMTIGELYLLRAEVAARLNDSTAAVTSLKALRVKRMSASEANAIPAGLTQLQLIQFILDERIREYALQGHRWFDMRRLSVDPLFSSTTYTHRLYSPTGALTATFTLRPERYTLRFPVAVMQQNTGMENNP